jgi:DivIVA domain-containing protein
MALDRQLIEKRDFPIGRRGYEPEAVDQHLARLADEIETLQRSPRGSGSTIAQAASEQVRAIVEAAEQSAQAIEQDAEADARRIRQEAVSDAERTDQEAVDRSRQHVAQVGEHSSAMLQRVDAMEQELGSLVETLRTGANRLKADLSLLENSMEELYTAAGGRPGARSAASAPAPQAAEPAPAAAVEEQPGPAVDEPARAAATPPEAAPRPERAAPAGATAAAGEADGGEAREDEDLEGARLIALNMALNGQPRDETDRYLAENFELSDREGLLDEVYASVGG